MASKRALLAVVLSVGFQPARAEDVEVWTYSGGQFNSVQGLANGDVVAAHKDGNEVLILTPTRPRGAAVVRSLSGLHAPDWGVQLGDGDVLLADTDNQTVERLAPDNSVSFSVTYYAPGGCVPQNLYQPSCLQLLANGDYLVADQGHARVLELDPSGAQVWQFGSTDCTNVADGVNAPFHVEQVAGGDILVVDAIAQTARRVTQTLPAGGVVQWQYGMQGAPGSEANQLSTPTRAHLLDNGDVLLADSGNQRVIQITPTGASGGTIAWQYGQTGVQGDSGGLLTSPYDVQRLANGDTLIADHSSNGLQEVSTLRVGLSDPGTVTRGACVELQVQIRDAYDVHAPSVDVPVDLQITEGDVALFSDAACSQSATQVTVASGTSQTNLWVRASSLQAATLEATTTNYATASESFEPVAPGQSPPSPDGGTPSTGKAPPHLDLGVGFSCDAAPDAAQAAWMVWTLGWGVAQFTRRRRT